jgi:hypothetical protein
MASEKTRPKGKNKRDDLTGEHAFGDAGQIILACLFGSLTLFPSVSGIRHLPHFPKIREQGEKTT